MQLLLFTAAETAATLARNAETDLKVIPRLVDNPASEYAGSSVASVKVRTGEYAPFWGEFLAGNPTISEEPDNLFLPSDV